MAVRLVLSMKRSSDSKRSPGLASKVPRVRTENPDLYTKIPAQRGSRKPGQFTSEQLRSFFEEVCDLKQS